MWRNVKRMEDIKLVKMITDWNLLGVRSKGRRKKRWRDKVISDLEMAQLRNWSQLVKDREA
jgi:hypothetical protein